MLPLQFYYTLTKTEGSIKNGQSTDTFSLETGLKRPLIKAFEALHALPVTVRCHCSGCPVLYIYCRTTDRCHCSGCPVLYIYCRTSSPREYCMLGNNKQL